MSEKFEVLEVGGGEGGRGKKTYSFEANSEYQGYTFHKFQRMVKTKDGTKWQTLTVSISDWPDFVEWLNYIIEEMGNPSKGGDTNPEDVPF